MLLLWTPGLNACVETGRIQEALALMASMREASIRPGHGAYNIIIKYWCRIGGNGAGGQAGQGTHGHHPL